MATATATRSKADPKKVFAVPGAADVDKAVAAYRQQQKQAGHSGADLNTLVSAYRKQQNDALNTKLSANIPESIRPYVSDPRQYEQYLVEGKGPAWLRQTLLRQANQDLGYGAPQSALLGEYGKNFSALAGEDPTQAGSNVQVARQFQETPTFTNFQDYVNRHINPQTGEAEGLTPEEEATIRGAGRDAIYGAQNQAMTGEESRLAAAGVDPRSGMAANRAMQIRAGTEGQLADLERSITDQNLNRKQEFEGYAQNLGQTEEARRQFDVTGNLRRVADVESGEGSLASLAEQQRQYDTNFAESQIQSKASRQAQKDAANALKPGVLEQVGSGLSGLFSGLGGGGGGGGGMKFGGG